MLGTELVHTTAFHPETNGAVERLHRRLKVSLTARGGDWMENLPWTLLGLRSVPREDDCVSPAEWVFGLPLTLPGTLLDVPDVNPTHLTQAFKMIQQGLPVRPPPAPQPQPHVPVLRWVYLRNDSHKPPLFPKYSGPYKVVLQLRNTAVIIIGDLEEKVNIGRLKLFHGSDPVESPAPPAQGRPRKS